jgi:hypothetical protein
MSGPFSWPWKLTTEYGEELTEAWRASAESDIVTFITAGKIQPMGPTSAAWDPLPAGGIGGIRYFTTREDAEEWAELDRARTLVIPRTIIAQVIEEK